MATIGSYTLLAAFIVCAYAIAVSVAGARRRSLQLVESGVGAFYSVTALMPLASAYVISIKFGISISFLANII